MSSHIHSPRDNGGVIMGVKSPAWFRAWFGEYDTDGFAEKNEACRHCKKHLAMAGQCYLGLCNECWTALLYYCQEVVNRQIDRHPEKWKGSERPDGLQFALYKIRRNIELGTFDLLRKVAIDGEPNTALKEAQKAAVKKEKARKYFREYRHAHRDAIRAAQTRYYKANREKRFAINKRFRESNLERIRAQNRKYREEHLKKFREYAKKYYLAHRDKIIAKKMERYWEKKKQQGGK